MARHSKKIDFTHWTGFSGSALAFGAGTAAITLGAATHEPETILRTRGSLTAWVDGTQAPATVAVIGIGFCIVPEGVGTTVTWSPLTDPDAPWFWFTSFALGYEEAVTDVIDLPTLSAYREVIDSKAMRKMRNSEIQVVFENITLNGAVTTNLHVEGRILTGAG